MAKAEEDVGNSKMLIKLVFLFVMSFRYNKLENVSELKKQWSYLYTRTVLPIEMDMKEVIFIQ